MGKYCCSYSCTIYRRSSYLNLSISIDQQNFVKLYFRPFVSF